MRHALIIAGGSGTRLWPMSRAALPKQLIPFIHGRSLLEIAVDRLAGLVPADRIFICAGEAHRAAICDGLKSFKPECFIGEPMGRDTLNAVGLGAAVIAKRDPDAVIAVFTADHVIEPVDQFRAIVDRGYALAEAQPNVLVTFGITPTHAVTGYGYLELGDALSGKKREDPHPGPLAKKGEGEAARVVEKFKEKPDLANAQQYLAAGPSKYLWNSGMFVWRAATLLDCIRRYEPATHEGLAKIAAAWGTPKQAETIASVYPALKKTSVDFGVMERASIDPSVKVAAIPMPLSWLDVGSWPSFAQTCEKDAAGNALGTPKHVLLDTKNTLVASNDAGHVIATIGCENLIVIHTPNATLVCRADRAEDIKKIHQMVGEKFGAELI